MPHASAFVFNALAGKVAVAVIHTQKVGDKTQQSVLFCLSHTVGKDNTPKCFDHTNAIFIRYNVLNGTGKAYCVRGFTLKRFRVRKK